MNYILLLFSFFYITHGFTQTMNINVETVYDLTSVTTNSANMSCKYEITNIQNDIDFIEAGIVWDDANWLNDMVNSYVGSAYYNVTKNVNTQNNRLEFGMYQKRLPTFSNGIAQVDVKISDPQYKLEPLLSNFEYIIQSFVKVYFKTGTSKVFLGTMHHLTTKPINIINNSISPINKELYSSNTSFNPLLTLTGEDASISPNNNDFYIQYQWCSFSVSPRFNTFGKSPRYYITRAIPGATNKDYTITERLQFGYTAETYYRVASVYDRNTQKLIGRFNSNMATIEYFPNGSLKKTTYLTLERFYVSRDEITGNPYYPAKINKGLYVSLSVNVPGSYFVRLFSNGQPLQRYPFGNLSTSSKEGIPVYTIDNPIYYFELKPEDYGKKISASIDPDGDGPIPPIYSKEIGVTEPDGDGNRYLYTEINNQKWMIENLYTTQTIDATPVKIKEINTASNWTSNTSTPSYAWPNYVSNTYNGNGFYYSFATVSKNICPVGWRVPTNPELRTLLTDVGGFNNAGMELKLNKSNQWDIAANRGNNIYNFNAQSGGILDINGSIVNVGDYFRIWGNLALFSLRISNDTKQATVYQATSSQFGFPIRCVK